jgi:hypothetical protein
MVLIELIFFMSERSQILAGVFALLIFFSIIFSVHLIGAFNEASAFNKFTTGRKATVWDALFVELRVESQCNNQKS